MKNTILEIASISMLLITACNQQEADQPQLDDLKFKVYQNEEQFMEAVQGTRGLIDSENIVLLDFSYDKSSGSYTIHAVKETELDHWVIPFHRSKAQQEDSDTYNVDCCCDSEGADLWSEECDGKWSCGSLIANCLDEGGCATICTARITYYPPINMIRVERQR